MNTPSKEDIIKIKIRKATRTLSEADKMIEFNFTNGAMNRLYYACFYAATALLFSKDIYIKTHSGVKQMLGLHFINSNLLPLSLGTFYGSIFMSRQNSDYDDFPDTTSELVKEYAVLAKEFVSAAKNILEL